MTILAHTKQASSDGNGFTTSPAIDTTGAHFLIVAVAATTTGFPTLTDSKSNTWVALTKWDPNSVNRATQLFYCLSPTVGTGHTFTLTGTTCNPSICVAATDTKFTYGNVQNGNGTSTGTVQTGSITPPSNGNTIWSGFVGQEDPVSVDSGFTTTDMQNHVGGAAFGCALAYLVQGTAAAVNPTWTNSAVDFCGASIAAFVPVNNFRRTLNALGTRIGSRQPQQG